MAFWRTGLAAVVLLPSWRSLGRLLMTLPVFTLPSSSTASLGGRTPAWQGWQALPWPVISGPGALFARRPSACAITQAAAVRNVLVFYWLAIQRAQRPDRESRNTTNKQVKQYGHGTPWRHAFIQI